MDFNNANLPLGLGIGLAMDDVARAGFGSLSETEKEHVILKCKDAKSREEMDKIIDTISPREEIRSIVEGEDSVSG